MIDRDSADGSDQRGNWQQQYEKPIEPMREQPPGDEDESDPEGNDKDEWPLTLRQDRKYEKRRDGKAGTERTPGVPRELVNKLARRESVAVLVGLWGMDFGELAIFFGRARAAVESGVEERVGGIVGECPVFGEPRTAGGERGQ